MMPLRLLFYIMISSLVVTKSFPLGNVGGFPTIPEINTWFQTLSENLQSNTSYSFLSEVIGHSFQDRDIIAYCIGICNNENDNKIPAAFFNAMHHSREPEGNLKYTCYDR